MRVAIVGTGISGLVTAYLLANDHEVSVFESDNYVGGHTNTVDVPLSNGTYPVDTGFIVFNEATYPNFVTLLNRLGVAYKPSQMSFSVRSEETSLEYRPSSLSTLFAQKSNLFRPSFHRMIRDIFRFRRESEALLARNGDRTTLDDFLQDGDYSENFVKYFITPVGAAIWSSDPSTFGKFPIRSFAQFFKNHGILLARNQPQWQVVEGGSRKYVEKLIGTFQDRIRLRCPVISLERFSDHVEINSACGSSERFDHVIIAAHSDQALAMLSDPSESEREILGGIPYKENVAVLHTDTSLLPRRKSVWASWNVFVPRIDTDRVTLTYNMNMLQGLDAPVEFCLSLNMSHAIDPEKVIKTITYYHPVYTMEGMDAQKRKNEISGVGRTHYCGAYWGYGFHEDGVNSALDVAAYFGKSLES
jgi:uncharacterized protein